jgi:hypothetical protein
LKVLHLLHQPMEIFFVYILWNGNAGFPEMTGFPKVQVRNNQCFFFFPEQASFCTQPALL